MDVEFLREAFNRQRKDGAAGLSGLTVKDYGRNLEANLIDLHERLREQRYRAPLIKRVWIDKEGGKKRPIGLSEIEDKNHPQCLSACGVTKLCVRAVLRL